MRDEAALLPRAALHERADAGDLWIPVDLVEAGKDRVILGHVDNRAIGKDPFDFVLEGLPFERPVKIVEHRGPAAQKELAQDRHLALEQLQRAGLDEVDPWILKEPRIVERHHDRILDVNRRRGLHAARQVLLGGRTVDEPRLAGKLLRD